MQLLDPLDPLLNNKDKKKKPALTATHRFCLFSFEAVIHTHTHTKNLFLKGFHIDEELGSDLVGQGYKGRADHGETAVRGLEKLFGREGRTDVSVPQPGVEPGARENPRLLFGGQVGYAMWEECLDVIHDWERFSWKKKCSWLCSTE